MLRYFHHAPPPFHYLLPPAADGAASCAVPVGQLARSTLRGLQLLPQLQWPVAAALPALLQHADADVRWCAAECAALAFGLQDASRAKVGCSCSKGRSPRLQGLPPGPAPATCLSCHLPELLVTSRPNLALPLVQLAGRVLSEEEEAQCRLRWQNERAMYCAELAVMYCSSTSSSHGLAAGSSGQQAEAMDAAPTPPAARRGAGAARSGDSSGSRKRKHGGGGEDSDADTAALGGAAGGMAPAAGYVEVCGLELPQRQQHGGGGGAALAPLVHTPAVDHNLEALALGGCQAAGAAISRHRRAGSSCARHGSLHGCYQASSSVASRLHPPAPPACAADCLPAGPACLQACAWAAPSCWRAPPAAASRR